MENVMFWHVSVCLSSGEGYPYSVLKSKGVPPSKVKMGVPLARTGWGYSSVKEEETSTWYRSGDMLLAFRQEDFIVESKSAAVQNRSFCFCALN